MFHTNNLSFAVSIILCILVRSAFSVDLLRLDSGNFELAITNYAYVAVAFLDRSEESEFLEQQWEIAAPLISQKWSEENNRELPAVALIDGTDPDIAEIVEIYGIELPGVRVFRNSMLYDYTGPYEAQPAATFIIEDSKPSVTVLQSGEALVEMISDFNLIVIGLFEESDIEDEGMMDGGLSLSPWRHFQSAADALRGLATFAAVTEENKELLEDFYDEEEVLEFPSVMILTGIDDDDDDVGMAMWPQVYTGDMTAQDLGMALTDWVLAVSMGPGGGGQLMIELTQHDAVATTRFFSSSLTKGIAFLSEEDAAEDGDMMKALRESAEELLGVVMFGYVVDNGFPEVSEYFDVDMHESSVLIAHDPVQDLKFRSPFVEPFILENIITFMNDVAKGKVAPSAKSEPIPTKNTGPVKILVGSTFAEEVSREGIDVMVLIHAPWCMHCKELAPTYEILGRSFSGDDRIIIAKFDATKNDLPPSIDVEGFPTLLWFPASSKPYPNPTLPKALEYNEPGRSLHDLVGFITRESSIPIDSIRMATAEQLATLMQEEDALRIKFEQEAQWALRNKDRLVYEIEVLDYLAGEVIFDGKRWMVAAFGSLCALNVILVMFLFSPSKKSRKRNKAKKN